MAPRNFNPPRCDLANKEFPLPSRANFEQFSSADWNQFFSSENCSGEDHTMTALMDPIPFGNDAMSEILNPYSLSENFLSIPAPDFHTAGDQKNREKSLIPKDEQAHSRGKRGQSVNSHSLAERLRREKISERMRFLQHLVPGCSKITGKAVMLDEIINYVQSLQRQVEFLSMKLATVSPEMNLDIQRLLSQDILLRQAERASDAQSAPETPSNALATSFLPGGFRER